MAQDVLVTVPYFNSSPNDSCSILLAQYLGGPDLLPSLTLSNANPVDEGQSASFQVTLSATSPYDVSAYYSTSNGSALAGQNYVARSPGMVVIPAGENTASISVATIDDGIDGPSECFNLTVTGAQQRVGLGHADRRRLDTEHRREGGGRDGRQRGDCQRRRKGLVPHHALGQWI